MLAYITLIYVAFILMCTCRIVFGILMSSGTLYAAFPVGNVISSSFDSSYILLAMHQTVPLLDVTTAP